MLPPRSGPSPAPAATPTPAVVTTVAPPVRERLLSLDVFRGLTVAGMLLVNDPGSWGAIYPPLEHAEWHGWTPTDLIFPFFLFIVGITTQLSLNARRARGADEGAIIRQVLRRGALIFLFGLLLNWFPFFQWDQIPGVAHPTFAQRIVYRLEHLRYMGVLQRIGLAYITAALLTWKTTLKQQVVILGALLYGYWFLMTLVPVPPHGMVGQLVLDQPGATLDAWLDRVLLTPNHLWVGGNGVRDPEGLLSTIPAACTAIFGNFAGRWIAQRDRPIHERLAGLFAAGSLGMMGGLIWNWSFPINKSLWTSSYVLFTAGTACLVLATVAWLVDVVRWDAWAAPFRAFGLNPILAYVGAELSARILHSTIKWKLDGRRVGSEVAVTRALASLGLDPRVASLAWALLFVAAWWAVLRRLDRRGYYWRI
jgi:predicted acyltransferase